MPIYWSYKSVPELASLPPKRRKQVWRECIWKTGTPRWIWWGYISVLVLSGSVWYFVFPPLWPTLSLHTFMWMVWLIGWGVFFGHAKVRAALPAIREKVGGLCPQCGYDIRATPTQCPECGNLLNASQSTSAQTTPQSPDQPR